MAIPPDPVDRRPVDVHHHHPVETRSNAGRTILIVAVVAVVLLAVAWAAGLFNVSTDGTLEAPSVSVEGGSVPDVSVDTADIDVGTKTETVEVPTIDVTPAGEGPANAPE